MAADHLEKIRPAVPHVPIAARNLYENSAERVRAATTPELR
jgi:hypothetical protein